MSRTLFPPPPSSPRFEATFQVKGVAEDGYVHTVRLVPCSGPGTGFDLTMPVHGQGWTLAGEEVSWPGKALARGLFVGAVVKVTLEAATEILAEPRFFLPSTSLPIARSATEADQFGRLVCDPKATGYGVIPFCAVKGSLLGTRLVEVQPITAPPSSPFWINPQHVGSFTPIEDLAAAHAQVQAVADQNYALAEQARKLADDRERAISLRAKFDAIVRVHVPHETTRERDGRPLPFSEVIEGRQVYVAHDDDIEVRFYRDTFSAGDPALDWKHPDILGAICKHSHGDHDPADCPEDIWVTDECTTPHAPLDIANSGFILRRANRDESIRRRVIENLKTLGFHSFIVREVHHDADGKILHEVAFAKD